MTATAMDGEASRPGFSPWVVVAAAAAIVTLSMGIRQTFGLFLRPMALDIEVGREAFGLAIALQNLLWGLAQPFVGALADRHGAGRVAAACGVLYAAGLFAASASADALGLQLSLGVLIGFALSGTTFGVALGAVARRVPAAQRGAAFGIVTAGGSLGQFLVVPGAQAMINGFGWRFSLVLLAGLALAMAALAIGVSGRPRVVASAGGSAGSMRAALGEAAGHGGFWLLTAGFFVCGFHLAFIATHFPAFLTDSGLPAATGAWALALIGLFNIFGSYLFGLSADRFRKKRVLAGIYLGRAALIAAFLALPITAANALVFAAIMGFLWLGTVPLTSGLVGQIFGVRYLSTLFSIVFLSHQVGSFFGAWAAGLAYEATGSYDAIWAATIALGIAAALLHWPIRDAPVAREAAA
jgi:predicted MFS family arabinose efflux permease